MKSDVYIKGFAKGRNMINTMKALNIAEIAHEGQERKGGGPYLDHPLRVASTLLALQIYDDVTIAAALLHDAIEDNEEFKKCNGELFVTKYGLNREVLNVILKLTKEKGKSEDLYYKNMEDDIRVILIKCSDRCHNLSTMCGAFSDDKMNQYVNETTQYILPLIRRGKRYFPEYSDALYAMKYHIKSNMDFVKYICHKEQKL